MTSQQTNVFSWLLIGAFTLVLLATAALSLKGRRQQDHSGTELSMTNFETDGFLSDEMPGFEAPAAEKYEQKFALAVDTNRLAHKLIYSIEIHNEHLPDILLATLLTRQATSFQAFYLLLTKGLFFQSQILLRNIAENMFIVGASRRDPEFVTKFVVAEEISRKKSLEALMRDEQKRGNDVAQEVIDLVASLAEMIADRNITAFSTEQIAQIADLTSYYDTLYRLTSMSVHTSPRGLDSALQTDEDGAILAITYEPKFDDLDMYVDFGISMMLYTLHEVASHFNQAVDEIEALQETNQQIAGPT